MPDYKVGLKDGFTFHTPDPNLLLQQEGKDPITVSDPDPMNSFFAAMPGVAVIENVDDGQVFTNPTATEEEIQKVTTEPVTNEQIAFKPAIATPTPTESDQIITRVNNGEVIPLSELDKIESVTARTAAARTLAQNIVKGLDSGQSATDQLNQIYLKYFDSPTAGGFGPGAESVGYTVPQSELIEAYEEGASFFAPNANTTTKPTFVDWIPVTEVPDRFKGVFETADEYNAWRAKGSPGEDELFNMPDLGGDAATGAEAGAPGTMDIFGQMQTQEQFPADVFRRFLAEQVSPSGEPRTLSPFLMRGAQDLRPQLMSEYNASFFDPSTWSPEGPTTTFGDWLRAGERPTRQGMFSTLQDIGNIVAGGDQALNAPGLSLNESLRRADIQNRFGMDTEDSRKLLGGMFTTAALSGVAPAFRYPIQSAAQNLFQSQRALQPEKSFLSFLSERL